MARFALLGKRNIVGKNMKIAGGLGQEAAICAHLPRFALLRHEYLETETTGQESQHSHWDLMLEHAGARALVTFQLQELPPKILGHAESEATLVPAIRIADHRPLYLDYEGEISGNRGSVRRIWAGQYAILPKPRILNEPPSSWKMQHGTELKPGAFLHLWTRPIEEESNSPGAVFEFPDCEIGDNCSLHFFSWTVTSDASS
ncbi:MAG: hypothetical protein AAF483_02760 [Planctomycetota bacterium]